MAFAQLLSRFLAMARFVRRRDDSGAPDIGCSTGPYFHGMPQESEDRSQKSEVKTGIFPMNSFLRLPESSRVISEPGIHQESRSSLLTPDF
jgi:hypothetical protein